MVQDFFSDNQIPFWQFNCATRILAYRDTAPAREGLKRLITMKQAQNPLLVTDQGVAETGFIGDLTANLDVNVLTVGSEGDMSPLREYADDANAMAADLLIAIGGGSVLDAAKCLAACLPTGTPPEALLRLTRAPARICPLICVPTTFGTGSEINTTTHLHMPEGKMSFKRPWLAPEVALLVGEAGCSLPNEARYLTAVDAWLHAFECLTLRRERSPLLDALMSHALELHEKNLSRWLNRPDAESGLAIACASCLGGLGINNARTGLIHALAVPFADRTGLPHNQSLLPFIETSIVYNDLAVKDRFDMEAEAFLDHWHDKLLAPIDEIMTSWPIEWAEHLSEEMAQNVMTDRVLFKENPVDLSEQQLVRLFQTALEPLSKA